MEVFLIINGYEIVASVEVQEAIVLQVAAGQMDKESFTKWVESVVQLIS
jgi:death on curing protein